MLQCCELLDVLGVPYLQSVGEAEALCALLNNEGVINLHGFWLRNYSQVFDALFYWFGGVVSLSKKFT